MPERETDDITLPEGARVLELPPFERSVALALEVARLGVSDEAIEALGGEEALLTVRRGRGEVSDTQGNGDNGYGHTGTVE